jgi:hypothetical protein
MFLALSRAPNDSSRSFPPLLKVVAALRQDLYHYLLQERMATDKTRYRKTKGRKTDLLSYHTIPLAHQHTTNFIPHVPLIPHPKRYTKTHSRSCPTADQSVPCKKRSVRNTGNGEGSSKPYNTIARPRTKRSENLSCLAPLAEA